MFGVYHYLYSSVCSQVLEGKPIYADCFGNLVPLTKSGQHHLFSFFAFKENRLALFIKVSTVTHMFISQRRQQQFIILNYSNLTRMIILTDQRQHSGAVWPSVLYERTQELQVTHPECHMQPQHHPPIILQGKSLMMFCDSAKDCCVSYCCK